MKNANITCTDGLFLLDNIPFSIDAEKAADTLRISRDSEDSDSLKDLLREAEITGAPKAVYRVSYIDERTGDTVVIGGKKFKSRVLSVNLEKAHRVFPYVMTCGIELEEWSKTHHDPLFAYLADHIKKAALAAATKFARDYIKGTYHLSKFSTMAPGSLEDWPIEQQKPLFELLGNVKETAGVVLTDSFLMLPTKSISGIIFPTETSFESCMLCPREKCIGRRAPYNEKLYQERYRKQIT